jgi:hypothetical protein
MAATAALPDQDEIATQSVQDAAGIKQNRYAMQHAGSMHFRFCTIPG